MGLTPVQSGYKHVLVKTSIVRNDPAPPVFATGQVLAWTGLNADTLRYWKKKLPPIAGRDGRSSGYSFEELVALAVIARATNQLGVPITVFVDHADDVFEAVALNAADSSQANLMFVHGNEISFGGAEAMPEIEVLALVRIDRVLIDIRDQITATASPPPQGNLFQLSA
jgi:hypothetical protein